MNQASNNSLNGVNIDQLVGTIEAVKGNYSRATEYYEAGLSIKRELGDRLGATDLMLNLGNLQIYQGNYKEAESILEKCLPVYRELGYQYGVMGRVSSQGKRLFVPDR